MLNQSSGFRKPSSRSRSQSTHLRLENLEARLAPASATFSGGQLDIYPDGSEAHLRLRDNNVSFGTSKRMVCKRHRAEYLEDCGPRQREANYFEIDNDLNVSAELIGGGGDDTLNGGGGDDTLTGGDGNDMLIEEADADLQLSSGFLQGKGSDNLSGIESAA